ncbi:hypothetical protein Tco_0548370 [Tanacetum coccineum]
MLNRRAQSRITNCDLLTRKGPITLKVYREDGTDEVIPNIKASDLHLGEWRKVVKACLNRLGADKPLGELNPLDKLNDLARKKRKHADDIHDLFRHDSVTIEDFEDFPNKMLYTIQEIFFRLHQGPGLDDHAKTFSSFLLAKVYKRNLNHLKQMRVYMHTAPFGHVGGLLSALAILLVGPCHVYQNLKLRYDQQKRSFNTTLNGERRCDLSGVGFSMGKDTSWSCISLAILHGVDTIKN